MASEASAIAMCVIVFIPFLFRSPPPRKRRMIKNIYTGSLGLCLRSSCLKSRKVIKVLNKFYAMYWWYMACFCSAHIT